MAHDLDDQSSVQYAEASSQETLDKGTVTSFDVEGDVPASANRRMSSFATG